MRNSRASWLQALNSGWLGIVELERCRRDAKLYRTKKAWLKGNPDIYELATAKGVSDLCIEPDADQSQSGGVTFEACSRDSIKYIRVSDWEKYSPTMYDLAVAKGWWGSCITHMRDDRPWTLERCKSEAKIFKSKSAWKREKNRSYVEAERNGWLHECIRCQRLSK
ncbi:hypothetical protein [Photobacterium kishitanii]|nr:hypothetical protein [Photobacterium kishitanii]